MLEWCPLGRRRKGRPRNSWIQEVTSGMAEKGINYIEWNDIQELRRKIKHQAQQDVKNIFSVHNNNFIYLNTGS